MRDIERDIFKKENRKQIEWGDDIVVLFYDSGELIKGTLDMIKHCDLRTDDIVYDFKEYNENRYIYDICNKLEFDKETCSYKFGLWEMIVLDI